MSQSYFGLPRQSVRNNSDIIILFKQSLRDVESMYRDTVAYDMAYCELEKCVVKLGVKNLTICLLIRLNIKMKENFVFSMEAKTHISNAILNVKLFSFLNVVSNQR